MDSTDVIGRTKTQVVTYMKSNGDRGQIILTVPAGWTAITVAEEYHRTLKEQHGATRIVEVADVLISRTQPLTMSRAKFDAPLSVQAPTVLFYEPPRPMGTYTESRRL
jgi:hypothetical protein